MAAPLRLHAPFAASPLLSKPALWERDSLEGGLSRGHGVSPGDPVAGRHCGTGRALRLRTALPLSQRSLSRLPPPQPAPQIPGLPTRELDGPDQTGSALRSFPKDPESWGRGSQACFRLSPNARQCRGPLGLHSWSRPGELHNAGAAASPGPFPGDPGRARPSAIISAILFPSPRCSSRALKARGWARL